jgi:hypothetical protein
MDIQIKYGLGAIFIYKPVQNRPYNVLIDRFLKNTLQALDYLYFKDIMMVTYYKNSPQEITIDIIDQLIDFTPEPIQIEYGETNQYFPNTNTIKFNDLNGVMFRKEYRKRFSGSNIGFNSPVSLLAHELVHCYHELFDENSYRMRKLDQSMVGAKIAENGKDLSFPNQEEELVVTLTNQICERLGEDKRGNYGRNYYLTQNVLTIDKKNA